MDDQSGRVKSTAIVEVSMHRFCRLGWTVMVLAGYCVVSVSLAAAQRPRLSKKVPPPKHVTLTTKDGVKLGVTYFASNLGQEAVPVVMLHDFKESRAVFNSLARALQNPAEKKHDSVAVLTVDLRGHGDSTSIVDFSGRTRELEAARLKPLDFQNMVRFDMEAVRKFLVKKNDQRELNLNKLCLVGTGMGANVATTWAAVDWSAPPLARRKQGQDVKALVLVSPQWNFRGLPLLRPIKQPGVREKLSILIAYGQRDSKAAKDARILYKNLEKFHPEPPLDQQREKKDLFLFPLPTKLQGTRLLTDPDFGMQPKLATFIDLRLSQKDFEWIARRTGN